MSDNADHLRRFSFVGYPVRGQWVRLRQTLRDANQYRVYPEPIQRLLGHMLAAVSMFADNLKFDGAVALQSQGNGPLIRSLAECRHHHLLRGIAHLDDELTYPDDTDSLLAWLNQGRLALSLIPEQDSGQQPYQGLIELSATTLQQNLEHYFLTSEQLPTQIFFADTTDCVTALLLQRLPHDDLASEIDIAAADDAWHTIQTLAATVSEAELASLPAEQLLRRLFAEYAVNLFEPKHLEYRCTCSRTKTDRTLAVMAHEELDELIAELGEITVDCEFCGQRYRYDVVDVDALKRHAQTNRDSAVRH